MIRIQSHIITLLVIVMILFSACSKKCVVNGCRVRMVHRHDGKKFKSKIRPWYAYQQPRVGRDVKRDKNPDKIPWKYDPPTPESDDLIASTDSTGLGNDLIDSGTDDPFADQGNVSETESDPFASDLIEEEEESGKKKKKKKKKKGEEEEIVKEKKDPWDIENMEETETGGGSF